MIIVIPRDTKLPCSITKIIQLCMMVKKTIDCSVTQSEGEERMSNLLML